MEQDNITNQVDSTSNASSSEGSKDVVSYESFRKSVAAEKAAKDKARELESQLESYKQKELESSGKTEEFITSLKEKARSLESQLESERKNYAWERISSTVKQEAVKQGFKYQPEAFIKLLDADDFRSMQVGDGFKVDQTSLSNVVEKMKKNYSDMFVQKGPSINDVTPMTKIDKEKDIDLKSMSKDELEKLILSKFAKK